MKRTVAILGVLGLLLPAITVASQEYCDSVLVLRQEIDERIYATRTQRKSARSVNASLEAARTLRDSLDEVINECGNTSAIEQEGPSIDGGGLVAYSRESGRRVFAAQAGRDETKMMAFEIIYDLGRREGLTEAEITALADTTAISLLEGFLITFPSNAIDNICPALLRDDDSSRPFYERASWIIQSTESGFTTFSELVPSFSTYDSEKDSENMTYLYEVLAENTDLFLEAFCHGLEQMWEES